MFKLPRTLPTITLPTLPTLPEFPGIDFSGLDINALRDRLASIDTTKLTDALRDAGYIAVGIGVTSIERAKARGEQITELVTNRFEQARGLLRTAA
jgi:hypothetical protein